MTLPTATAGETAGVLADVVAPLVARGVIVRRPRIEGALDRFDADRRAVRRLQALRRRHGEAPVLLRLPGRDVVIVLAPDDVRRVLEGTPEPFAAASREKRAALGHFQPNGVLVSHGAVRADRRRFNEDVLQPGRPQHELAPALASVVREETTPLLSGGELGWDRFAQAWWRAVRRVVLGDRARDDDAVTDLLTRLRRDANWAFAKPRRTSLRRRFEARLRGHLARAEPASLAALVAAHETDDRGGQVPQWLFAFDAAGMAAFRALSLIAAHPGARDDLRACMLESIRLWPTTPAILRDATRPTPLGEGDVPDGAAIVIFAPFFHRDGERLAFADRFAPELWRDGADPARWPLVPFSAGPAECPGRDLVLLLTGTLLATLLEQRHVRALEPLAEPLPASLSPFRLRFELV